MNRMQSSYTDVLRALWRLQRPVTLGATLVGTAGVLASAWLLSGINDTLHAPDRLNPVLALKLAGLGHAHKVRLEQGRFSTTDLSTGRRRRLVQALAEHRPVLMLDEWAADQDPVFHRIFYTEILPELKSAGRTLIVISHDDHYFAAADHIIHLDEGRIINDSHPTGTGQGRHATRAQGRHPSETGTMVPPVI